MDNMKLSRVFKLRPPFTVFHVYLTALSIYMRMFCLFLSILVMNNRNTCVPQLIIIRFVSKKPKVTSKHRDPTDHVHVYHTVFIFGQNINAHVVSFRN